MRKQFIEFASNNIPTPNLAELSAMGANFRVYELTMMDHQLLPVPLCSIRDSLSTSSVRRGK